MNQHQFQVWWPNNHQMVPQRRWLCSNSHFSLNDYMSRITFSVMSYNILSQKLLEEHMYLYQCSPSDALNWDYRSKNLISEIKRHDVDIVCLQELEEFEYINTFKPQLFEFGYQSIYKKKTGGKADGCAIFYKIHAFSLDEYVAVEFRRPSESLLNRDNIGLVALFKPLGVKNRNMKFCVATTHLLFNPKRGDVKLAQLRLLLAEIDKMAFKEVSSSNALEYHPIILCGDFNSVPFSPLYNFITTGHIYCTGMLTGEVSGQAEGLKKGWQMPPKCVDLKSLGIDRRCQYVDSTSLLPLAAKLEMDDDTFALTDDERWVPEEESRLMPGMEDCLFRRPKSGVDEIYRHNLNFASAYKHVALDGSEEVTTCHSRAQCTVDYIFYSQPTQCFSEDEPEKMGSLLTVLGVYSLFSVAEMDLLGELPNRTFPSDHMCLITRFALSSL